MPLPLAAFALPLLGAWSPGIAAPLLVSAPAMSAPVAASSPFADPAPADPTAAPYDGGRLDFAGLSWAVRRGAGGPGPNAWAPDHAWVDDAGRLHLRLDRRGDGWAGAEVRTDARFGPGTFRIEVAAPVDTMHPRAVVGLFLYPTPDVGPDGTHEVDVELTGWGDADRPRVHFSAWPLNPGATLRTAARAERFEGTHMTYVVRRDARGVRIAGRHGHGAASVPFATPAFTAPRGSLAPMPLHLNVWWYEGRAPAGAAPVEVVVTRIDFTPAA